MAASPLTSSSFYTKPTIKPEFEPPSLSSEINFSRNSIKCELNSSLKRTRKWSFDRTSEAIHPQILHRPFNSLTMESTSLNSNSLKKNWKKIYLFYCDEMKELALRIAAESDFIELRNITWRKFEDGFPNLFISNAHGIRGQPVAFLASFSSPAVIFEQLSVIYALPKLFISSFTLVLPFFPTGTSERVEEEGDIATAFALSRILSNIPISRGGPTSLVIYDIHALQERFYFGDNVLPCFESGIPLLKNRLQQLPDSDNITIAFPDDGAWKRFHKQLQHFPMIICGKVREGDQRIVRLKEGDPRCHHVVIVDYLVQSGGTLIECQKVLAAHGASKISAYVTHGIFPNRTWERFQHDDGGCPENGLTYFWITDSCPCTVEQVKDRKPFEVLSLAGSIAAALQI
ncbi:ribose phosphate diphosphokinase subunit prs3 [Ranunculus cassubicifolius]